jgi:hypothetical protein
MPGNILLPTIFIPVDEVKLGRFIVNYKHPHQDFHDPQCSYEPRQLVNTIEDYTASSQKFKSNGARSTFTSMLASSFSKRAKSDIQVDTGVVKSYALQNSGRWFRDAMALEETRIWIEDEVDIGHDIFMIAGFYTMSDARVVHQSTRERKVEGQIEAPVELSIAASVGAVVPLGVGDLLNPGVSAHRQKINFENGGLVAPGEQIFALQYFQVDRRWYSKDSKSLKLSKNPSWEIANPLRGDDDESIIEVELVDLGVLEDMTDEISGPDGDIFVSVS